jgi:hypothetical protein
VAVWLVSVPAVASVLMAIVLAYRDIRIRRDRHQLIRDALERGDNTALMIVAVTTADQNESNHDIKVIKPSYLPRL